MKEVEGVIAYYHLEDWWLATFSDEEREYMDSRYQPMGASTHTLTSGRVFSRGGSAPQFLNGLNTWFRSPQDASIHERIHQKLRELAREHPITGAGYYDGRHFTTYVQDVEDLKRAGNEGEAEYLLLNLVAATEAEAQSQQTAVAPWYYEQLAILYRKQKEYAKEVAILERFTAQSHGSGVTPPKLLVRLDKARKLAATN